MAEFIQKDYTDLVTDYNIKDGELANEVSLTRSSNRIKRESDMTYNIQRLQRNLLCIPWRITQEYLVGELVSNSGINYVCKVANTGVTPTVGANWEVATADTYGLLTRSSTEDTAIIYAIALG